MSDDVAFGVCHTDTLFDLGSEYAMMHIEVVSGYAECRCCHNLFNRLDDPHGNIICWDCHTAGCNNSGCKRELYVAWQHQMNATP